jgi:hypothetical protein
MSLTHIITKRTDPTGVTTTEVDIRMDCMDIPVNWKLILVDCMEILVITVMDMDISDLQGILLTLGAIKMKQKCPKVMEMVTSTVRK